MQKFRAIEKVSMNLFPKFEQIMFMNIVAGDETWVYIFEPQRRIDNKKWATRNARRPVTAKRTLSV